MYILHFFLYLCDENLATSLLLSLTLASRLRLTHLQTLCHVTKRYEGNDTWCHKKRKKKTGQTIMQDTLANELNEKSTCIFPPQSVSGDHFPFVLTLKQRSRATASIYYQGKIQTANILCFLKLSIICIWCAYNKKKNSALRGMRKMNRKEKHCICLDCKQNKKTKDI